MERRTEENGAIHKKLQEWLATREKPFLITEAAEACGITERPVSRATITRIGIALKTMGCNRTELRNNFNGVYVSVRRCWTPPAATRIDRTSKRAENSYIICGPQGIGKTRCSLRLNVLFGTKFIADNWDGMTNLGDNVLYITNCEPSVIFPGVRLHLVPDVDALYRLIESQRG